MTTTSSDPFASAEWRDFAERAIRELVPKMQDSDVIVSINSSNPDVKLAVELGFALLLGKPIIMLADRGAVLPPGLTRAADKIIYGEIQHPKTAAKVKAAMDEILEPEKSP